MQSNIINISLFLFNERFLATCYLERIIYYRIKADS